MANITDHYDRKRLEEAGKILAEVEEGVSTPTPQNPAIFVISMRDAIASAEDTKHDYTQRTDLSEQQKYLIAAVAEDRKDPRDRKVSDFVAQHDGWITLNYNIAREFQGKHYTGHKLSALNPSNIDEKITPKYLVLHHELTHSFQEITIPMPEGLSSYDQKLWYLGMEGQAFVAEADEKARRENKSLTDEEKRRIFSDAGKNDIYLRYYDVANSTRTDGRRLTMRELEQAFGFVPGHKKDKKEDNFLAGANYNDPADLIETDYRRGAERKPLRYGELSVVSIWSDNARFDSPDKNYVVLVSHKKGSDDAHVRVYGRKHLPRGEAYVLADERDVRTVETAPYDHGQRRSYGQGFSIPGKEAYQGFSLEMNIGKNGRIALKATVYFPRDREYPFERHQNTMLERLLSPSIEDSPVFVPGHFIPMPEGLSSYDQKLWKLGMERQAEVTQAVEAARRNWKVLTQEEKRQIFSHWSRDLDYEYAERYNIYYSTRWDGRRLTVQEYEKAFGVISGHEKEGNFLTGGHYKDAADILIGPVDGYPRLAFVRQEAERKPLKYEELPVAAAGSGNARFDNGGKRYVMLVSHAEGSDDAQVQVYGRKPFPQGDAYILAEEKNVKTMEAAEDGHPSWGRAFVSGGKREFNWSLEIRRDGRITAKEERSRDGTGTPPFDEIPLAPHRNTSQELHNPTIQYFPRPPQKSVPKKNSSLELPDDVKSAAQTAGELARSCNPIACDGEATIASSNAYIRSVPSVMGGRES